MSNNQQRQELTAKMLSCLKHAAPEWTVAVSTERAGEVIVYDATLQVADGEVIKLSHKVMADVLAAYHPAMFPAHAEAIASRWRDKLRQWKKDNGR